MGTLVCSKDKRCTLKDSEDFSCEPCRGDTGFRYEVTGCFRQKVPDEWKYYENFKNKEDYCWCKKDTGSVLIDEYMSSGLVQEDGNSWMYGIKESAFPPNFWCDKGSWVPDKDIHDLHVTINCKTE
jgi:hypothetical protein